MFIENSPLNTPVDSKSAAVERIRKGCDFEIVITTIIFLKWADFRN